MLASPAFAAEVPYADANAVGTIALCDADGQSVTHGEVGARPFVWTAASAVAAPAPYDGAGRTATLFAYQPRRGTSPGEWSGQLMTASTQYSDAARPTAKATANDDRLADFLDVFPARWDGLVQLRMYLSAPGEPALTQRYAATNIRVAGDTWSLVGEAASCGVVDAAAVSLEDRVPQPASIKTDLAAAKFGPASASGQSAVTVPGTRPGGRIWIAGLAVPGLLTALFLGIRLKPKRVR
ncbi:MAG: hypothetical protein QOI61_354 [Actinomycetota bacterium]